MKNKILTYIDEKWRRMLKVETVAETKVRVEHVFAFSPLS
jgi:hypothetical protein